jgi:hypothetical protein
MIPLDCVAFVCYAQCHTPPRNDLKRDVPSRRPAQAYVRGMVRLRRLIVVIDSVHPPRSCAGEETPPAPRSFVAMDRPNPWSHAVGS